MTSCEGGDLYKIDSPDWIAAKIDSIENSKTTDEEVLEGMGTEQFPHGIMGMALALYIKHNGGKI